MVKFRFGIQILLYILATYSTACAEISYGERLAKAALEQIGVTTSYDPSYVKLKFPGGDVPISTGVCSDVVIRAYRALGIDLQKSVHEDMTKAFSNYPHSWGLKSPDSNIDHRRVPNLIRYFSRFGNVLRMSQSPEDYKTGEIVAWDLGAGLTHIGIVIEEKARPLIIHNIGQGTKKEDRLFEWKIIGHYSYPRS